MYIEDVNEAETTGEFPAMYIADVNEAEITGDIPINCYKLDKIQRFG